jgi:hypothetical protein
MELRDHRETKENQLVLGRSETPPAFVPNWKGWASNNSRRFVQATVRPK